MLRGLNEFDDAARDLGWWGFSEGPDDDDFMFYRCGCGSEEHLTARVTGKTDDLDYYDRWLEYMRQCTT